MSVTNESVGHLILAWGQPDGFQSTASLSSYSGITGWPGRSLPTSPVNYVVYQMESSEPGNPWHDFIDTRDW